MERFLRHFRFPLIVTGFAVGVMTIVGIVVMTSIAQSGGVRPNERAAQLGSGLGVLTSILVAPFWVYAVLQSGKERRAELKKANSKTKPSQTKKRSKG